ncbi:2Fe-2S iron-sulfur cluster-binding protein [Novosphingobium rosa]|uniref:2Fe-2S iron-sulfur cluster-binding protein n=1 Tax=Novosphingobium rosa TaxID=76978 RepID=UPI00083550A0|nr:2Fe-2S iron-sulfur cluster-binding protein [Novosphingobium rosa]
MTTFTVSTASTQDISVQATAGQSLMEALRDNGFEDIQAFCGGGCSCATCHVVVNPDWFAKLPPVSDDEQDLLESIEGRLATSRLACQIPLCDELEGMAIMIPPAV